MIDDQKLTWYCVCVCSQGYIAAVREFLGRENLRQWTNFRLKDFQERNNAGETFKKRHLPLSDGESHPEFGGLVVDPKVWDHPPESTRKKRVKKSPKGATKPAAKSDKGQSDVVMIYDPSTNEFVPCASDSSDS